MGKLLKETVIVNPELLEESQKTFNRVFSDKQGSVSVAKDSNFSKDKYSLIIKAPASHGGRLTKNNALYIPSRMKQSAKTMYQPYKKPILKEHTTGGKGFFDSSPPQDPIGRIFEATYHDYEKIEKYGLPSSLNIKDSLALIKDLMKKKVIYNRNFQGLGYTRIGAKITDQDAIEKFLDERYLTLSVSFAPLELFNPHTGKSVKDREEDDPYPFDMVDGLPGFIIVGNKEYVETSAVSIPASDLAIVEKEMELVQDSWDDQLFNDCFNPNTEERKIEKNSTYIIVDGFYNLEEKETQNNQDTNNNQTENPKMDHLEKLNQTLKKLFPSEISEDTFNAYPMDCFCGPDKTFPVNDSVSYQASLKMLEDSDLPSADKALIEKNIKRKANKLNLSKSNVSDNYSKLSDFDLIKMVDSLVTYVQTDREIPVEDVNALDKLLKDRKVDVSDSVKSELDLKTSEITDLNKTIQDKVVELKKSTEVSYKLLKALKDNLIYDFSVEENKTLEEMNNEVSEMLSDSALKEKLERFFKGLGTQPEGSDVQDPTIPGSDKDESGMLSILRDTYLNMKDEHGDEVAQNFLEKNLENGYLNQEEFDKIIENSSK